MANEPMRVAVGILQDALGQVLVNQRPPHSDFMPGYWEFPGGKVEAQEDGWQALVRELKEELGITVVAGCSLMVLQHHYPQRQVQLEIWQVTDYLGRPQSLEQQPLAWHHPDALPAIDLLPADEPIVAKLQALTQAQ
jgi:8-oxo-dGTP diphosphatase